MLWLLVYWLVIAGRKVIGYTCQHQIYYIIGNKSVAYFIQRKSDVQQNKTYFK